MKRVLHITLLALLPVWLFAQESKKKVIDLPIIALSKNVSLHFLSPEKIQYIDLSGNFLEGDLPLDHLARIKLRSDLISVLQSGDDIGVVTVVGETFIAQYRLNYLQVHQAEWVNTKVEIEHQDCRPLDISQVGVSQNELKQHAFSMLKTRVKKKIAKKSDFGLSMWVNNIYSLGDYVFLDMGFKNTTNLLFNVDEIRFKIEDKKVVKATNVQSIELEPKFTLYPFTQFKRNYRNIYVFKKATFPGHKRLNISLKETVVSGRNLTLALRYADLLGADTF